MTSRASFSGSSESRDGSRARRASAPPWPRLFLCSVLCHCGSAGSDGLFSTEASAPERAAMPAAPSLAGPASAAERPAARDETPAPPSPASDLGSSLPAPADATPSPAQPPAEPAEPAEPAPPEAADPEGGAAAPAPAEPASTIVIERARWNEDDAELEVRGEVSSPLVTLTVSFLDRSEPVPNDDGSFRVELSGVDDPPGQVNVAASDGATATARVEVD